MSKNLFTYKKMPVDLMLTTLENVLAAYPFPENEAGEKYSYFAHYRFPLEYVSDEFKEMIKFGEMEIKHAEIFYRPGVGEGFDAFIHTDGHEIVEGLAKINFIIGGEHNTMQWYVPNVELNENHIKKTSVNTKYLSFEPDEVDMIDETEMSGLYIVNAGIPHGVKMTEGGINKPRICISLVPKLIGSNNATNIGCEDAYLRLLYSMFKVGHIKHAEFRNEYERILGNSALPTQK
jgi:hypothetical protein